MKYILITLACLFPLGASAAMLGNCDSEPHEVIIRNGGAERTVILTRFGGEVQEFGPTVSFKIKGHPRVNVAYPDAEYCIWSGRITIQRLDTIATSHGGS